MSYLMATPQAVLASAGDLAQIGSTVSAANAAAAVPTAGVLAAGADPVSETIAALFASHAQTYQSFGAQAMAFHDRFVQALRASVGSYTTAEAANATPLDKVNGVVSALSQTPTGGSSGGNGANAAAVGGAGGIGSAGAPGASGGNSTPFGIGAAGGNHGGGVGATGGLKGGSGGGTAGAGGVGGVGAGGGSEVATPASPATTPAAAPEPASVAATKPQAVHPGNPIHADNSSHSDTPARRAENERDKPPLPIPLTGLRGLRRKLRSWSGLRAERGRLREPRDDVGSRPWGREELLDALGLRPPGHK